MPNRHDKTDVNLDRRKFLECLSWAGTAAMWTVTGGVLKSVPIEAAVRGGPASTADAGALRFVQISDTHIGFDKAANPDVVGTLREAIAKIQAAPDAPAFVLHTGDLTHLSKPAEFDTLQQVLSDLSTPVFYVPGEHDVLDEGGGRSYLDRFGRDTAGAGWYSFDQGGVHVIGLVNVVDLKAGGLGQLGAGQLRWLEQDLARLSDSTPIVVFAHIPLWTVYPEWGWGTDDSAQALALLKRFGSVSVLNGHIHQVMQKVEGHVAFHTAMSTAFPQPAPGTAPSPGPMVVPPDRLRRLLGLASVSFQDVRHPIAITDIPLDAGAEGSSAAVEATIDNFRFDPPALTIRTGTTVTWTNRDDVPHNVVGESFRSPVLDTDARYTHRFEAPGTYSYFCSLHPRMTGRIEVE